MAPEAARMTAHVAPTTSMLGSNPLANPMTKTAADPVTGEPPARQHDQVERGQEQWHEQVVPCDPLLKYGVRRVIGPVVDRHRRTDRMAAGHPLGILAGCRLRAVTVPLALVPA